MVYHPNGFELTSVNDSQTPLEEKEGSKCCEELGIMTTTMQWMNTKPYFEKQKKTDLFDTRHGRNGGMGSYTLLLCT